MTDQHLLAEFDALEFDEKMILALLALIGEPIGRAMILDHLRKAEINDSKNVRYKVETLDDTLRKLDRLAFISTVTGRGLVCNVKLRWPAIRAAIGAHMLDELADAHDLWCRCGRPGTRWNRAATAPAWRACAWRCCAACNANTWRHCCSSAKRVMSRRSCIR